jgi:polysaccharide pyruvyl transferase CsaB
LIDNYDVSPENVTVIHNGVDGSRFSPRTREGALTVGFLSRLDGDSSLGARLLCEIAPRLCERSRGIRIIIGGGGEELESIKGLAREANEIIGEECIACVGEVADTSAFLGACDIFVGVSRAAIEASLCSAAVVLCGNEGFGGVLDGENFLSARLSNFCARGDGVADGEKLLAALAALVAEGREALRARGEMLRALSLRYCSAERAAEDTEAIYRRACRYSGKREGSLLCGYYGFGNMGDDILLRAAAERARAEFSDGRVRALTNGGRRDSRRFGLACTCRHFPISVILEIARCRRLIFGGGTLLQSETSRRSFVYYASLLLLARLFHKDCILWGNGIGAVRGRFEKRLIGAALGCCSYIGLRDMRSLAIARHMLSKQGREGMAVLEGDLAERAESLYSDSERAEVLLSGLFGEDRREIVAAIPRGKRSEDELLRFSKILAREKARGREILMIVMNATEDGKVCEALARSLGGRLIFGICFGDTVELLRKCKRVYSMRLHGLVAAHLAGIELYGIGEDEKIKRYCAERGGTYLYKQENQ